LCRFTGKGNYIHHNYHSPHTIGGSKVMKIRVLCLLIALVVIGLVPMSNTFAQVAGDYGSAGTGRWGTTGANWLVFVANPDWSDATPAPGAPTAAINVWIRSGHTDTLEASSKACKNLTVQSGATLLAISGSNSLAINGDAQINGTLGSPTIGPLVQFPVSGKIFGSGAFYFARLRPSGTNVTITFDMDVTGAGSSGNYINCNSQNNTTFELKAGRTITLPTGGYISTASNSSTSDPGAGAGVNYTFNVYGTINAPIATGGGFSLANLPTFTSTLNVYSGGIVNTGRLSAVAAGTADPGAINVNIYSGGSVTINGGSGAASNDLTKATLNVAGSFSTGSFLTSSTIGNIIINNVAGISLACPTTIAGTLTLTNGNMTLGNNNLTLSGSVSGGSSSSYLVTTGTGVVSKVIAAAESFTFPVGTSTSYNPVGCTSAAGGTYTAAVADGEIPATTNDAASCLKTWAITGTSSADVTFTWNTADMGGSCIPTSCTAWYYDGAKWVEAGGSTTAGTPNTTTVNVSTSASWTVGNSGQLPVEMSTFTATSTAKGTVLRWRTETEVNNMGFEVERRVEATSDWMKIGFVAGAGTSNSPKEYTFADQNLTPGVYVYRINQIDNDGTSKYSASAQIDAGAVGKVFQLCENYPNPFNPTTNLQFSVPQDGYASLKVYNMVGQEVAMLYSGVAKAGHYIQATFNASRYASGIYFARLQFNGQSLVQRMLMTK
jgi:hypothetical protein